MTDRERDVFMKGTYDHKMPDTGNMPTLVVRKQYDGDEAVRRGRATAARLTPLPPTPGPERPPPTKEGFLKNIENAKVVAKFRAAIEDGRATYIHQPEPFTLTEGDYLIKLARDWESEQNKGQSTPTVQSTLKGYTLLPSKGGKYRRRKSNRRKTKRRKTKRRKTKRRRSNRRRSNRRK